MRRLLHYGLPYRLVLIFWALAFVGGCARPLLHTYPASEQETESASEAFSRFLEAGENICGCCLDAEADASLSVSGWFSDHTGKLSGYLQAMRPGYLRFVALNPLGQPLFIFVTNGKMFKSLNVFEEKAHAGSVYSETYKKFAPAGFEPEFSYYWLTGRLPPGVIQIGEVMRAGEEGNFWLQIKHADADTDSMVLFDPEELVILRHVLRDDRGEHLVDISYADYQQLPGKEGKGTGNGPAAIPGSAAAGEPCRIPARIMVSSKSGAGKIDVRLYSFMDKPHFSAEDFQLEIPGNFEQLPVK